MRRTLILLCLLPLSLPASTRAQQRRDLPQHALWLRVQDAHFRHTGVVPDLHPYDFDAPLFGVGYAGTGLQAEVAFGRAAAPVGRVRILDAEASVGSSMPLERSGRHVHFEAPLRLGFLYRRVRQAAGPAPADFDVQMLALQGGLGLRTGARRVQISASATAGAGLATRSFDGTPGYGLIGTAQIEARTRLNQRFGLVAGYRLRLHYWDLDTGFYGGERYRDLYDYRAHSHALHAGVVF